MTIIDAHNHPDWHGHDLPKFLANTIHVDIGKHLSPFLAYSDKLVSSGTPFPGKALRQARLLPAKCRLSATKTGCHEASMLLGSGNHLDLL